MNAFRPYSLTFVPGCSKNAKDVSLLMEGTREECLAAMASLMGIPLDEVGASKNHDPHHCPLDECEEDEEHYICKCDSYEVYCVNRLEEEFDTSLIYPDDLCDCHMEDLRICHHYDDIFRLDRWDAGFDDQQKETFLASLREEVAEYHQ